MSDFRYRNELPILCTAGNGRSHRMGEAQSRPPVILEHDTWDLV